MKYQLRKIVQQVLPYIQNKKYSDLLVSIFFIFLTTISLHSQNQKIKLPLVDILTQLENSSNYQFTYANDIIEGIVIDPPLTSLTFKEKINYLGKKTGLAFQFLDNNYIAIKSSNIALSICGYIIDAETKTPLEAVAVIGVKNQVITDSYGYFKLDASSSNEKISFSYLGFKTVSLEVNSFDMDKCSNIFLVPEIESLSEIVLSNFVAKGIDKVIDGSFNINFSNFGILPGLIETDVLQTIQALPGIQSADETVSNINIRGGSNDQNLLLWDGIRMYQSGHFFGLISIFNPQMTNNALIIKNGSDVDYDGAVSGVINMKTESEVTNRFKGSIGINLINADIFIDAPISTKSSLQVAARKAISEYGETPTYKNYFHRIEQDTEIPDEAHREAEFDFYDTSVRWLYEISEKDQIRANFLHAKNDLTFIEKAEIDSPLKLKSSELEQVTLAGGLFYKRKWNDTFTSLLQVSETEYQLDASKYEMSKELLLEQTNKIEETSIKLKTWLKHNDLFSFLNGYQYTETAINNLTNLDDPRFTRLVREVIREHSIFTQANFNSESKKTFLKLGARYSFIEKFNKHIIEPRLAINHKLSNAFSIELLGEYKHQNTSQIINVKNEFFGIEKRRWYLADEQKRPIIHSKQVSIGVNFSKRGWLLSLDNYFKNVDGISSQSQGFVNQYAFKEAIGSYDVYGVDFLLNKRIKRISTWLSYSYANNDYTFEDFSEITFSNNIEISHAVTFGISYSKNNLKFAAGINWWQRGAPTTEPVVDNEITNDQVNYQAANSSNLTSYFKTDVSATYTFNLANNIKSYLGVSVWNASDNPNIINTHYTPSENNDEVTKFSKNALELTPNVSFRVLF